MYVDCHWIGKIFNELETSSSSRLKTVRTAQNVERVANDEQAVLCVRGSATKCKTGRGRPKTARTVDA